MLKNGIGFYAIFELPFLTILNFSNQPILDFKKEVIWIGLQILECHFFQNAKVQINKWLIKTCNNPAFHFCKKNCKSWQHCLVQKVGSGLWGEVVDAAKTLGLQRGLAGKL